jgi:hypothetical protein
MSIVWLASYPKSGNTWLRVVLSNYWSEGGQSADINRLDSPIASRRQMFDLAAGVEASDLTHEEIDSLRPQVYRQIAANNRRTLYFKIHDAYTGELIPADATRGAVYIIRNPLDVAVSYAHHSNAPVEKTIGWMRDEKYGTSGGRRRLFDQLRQRLRSWSGHVLSWVDQTAVPVHVMRYEDMHARPLETFGAALRFSGVDYDEERLRSSLDHSSFEKLRQIEQTAGFAERPAGVEAFFRKGQAGGWKEVLDQEQVERVVGDHAEAMRRFGYLDTDGSTAL